MYSNSHVSALQALLRKEGIKAYLIVSGDPHTSEDAASYFFSERLYFCPYTGDAGQVLITQDKAYVFTDGRYFISAAKEIKDSPFELMKIGEKGVLPLSDFIAHEKLFPLGVNESMISENTYQSLTLKGQIVDKDYSSLVEGRPSLPLDKVFKLEDKLTTLTSEEKIKNVLAETEEKGAEANLVTTLDDIAWILNLRGHDIPYTPVFYSYLYLSKTQGNHLFINKEKIDFNLKGIAIHPYEEIVSFLESKKDIKTLVDPNRVNARLFNILVHPVRGHNPSYLSKSIKGEVEIKNTKEIQIIDGVALLKLMAFIDEHKDEKLSEWDYAVALDGFRHESKRLFDLSFNTIAACGGNAAMMHYAPTAAIHSPVDPSSVIELLVDSGGQYYGGTTDTTRTFLIGKPSKEYIHDYTLTLKSLIGVSKAVFIDGSCGVTIDIKARQYMWEEGMDYKCGTGHGVGYISNVHEGPNGFRYRIVPERDDSAPIVPGMITTIEPGVYKEDKYGIRIENNLLCVPAFTTEMGTFYKFETITMVPIETKALDLTLLTDDEIKWLNDYHKEVYKNLAPLVSGHLKDVLQEKTQPVKR